MLHLECAQPPREPGIGEGMGGGDRQQRLVFLAMAGEGGFDRIEGARQGREQALPERGQPGPPLLANEQRRAEPFFEALDLIGDGGLGHSELGRGGGEILGPRSRFEGPDRRQWWKPPHQLDRVHKATLSICRVFDWRNEPPILFTIKSPARTNPSPPSPPRRRPSKGRRLAMTYGLSTRAFIEDGPVEQVAKAECASARPRAPGARSTKPAASRSIEHALRAANDASTASRSRSDSNGTRKGWSP